MNGSEWQRNGRRPRGLRRAAVMTAMVVLVALAAFVARVGPGQRPAGRLAIDESLSPSEAAVEPSPIRTPRRTPTPTPSLAPTPPTAQGSWRPLPDPPLQARRTQPVSIDGAWFIWGGEHQEGRREFHADGAILASGAESWREVAEAPIAPRSGHVAVWTGSRMVVWGGEAARGYLDDGAAYDPVTDRWARLADAPLAPRANAAAAWTGDDVVVVGGYDNAGPRAEAAAYSPARDAWRALPPLPVDDVGSLWQVGALWTGRSVVAWWPGQDLGATSNVHALDPDSGRWHALPALDVSSAGAHLSLVNAGGRLVAVYEPYDFRIPSVSVLDEEAETWAELDVTSSSMRRWDGWGLVTTVNGRVFLLSASGGVVAHVTEEHAELLPEPPVPGEWTSALLAGDDRVLLWGVTHNRSGYTEDIVAHEWVPSPE